MNAKDNIVNDTSYRKLLNNDNYFKQIFKKTEKIISVVFYILKNTDVDKKSETQFSNIASKAHFAHENALRTLEVKPANAREVLEQFAQSLVGLDSTLRIAGATGVIAQDVHTVVINEIDVVLRGLKVYINQNNPTSGEAFSFTELPTAYEGPFTSTRTPKMRQIKKDTEHPSIPTGDDRRTRIKTILEAKGEATIKDISEIITDVSEKTIQRELNAMIEENLVKRQGERRWSKYSLF